MEIFEIHITGSSNIHQIAKKHNHKTIAVDLLRKNGSFLREEHMTSLIMKFEGINNYEECKKQVLAIADEYEREGVHLLRIKIESPIYDYYIGQGLYMESHFPATDFEYPVSRNQRKLTFLGTDRTYKHSEYDNFRQKHAGQDLELCLYDNFVEEDHDWLSIWS